MTDLSEMLLYLGGPISGIGVLVILLSRRNLRRVLALPLSLIADAPRSGEVALEGKVLAPEGGELKGPTGEQVVWFRVSAHQYNRSDSSNTVLKVEHRGVPFDIEDASDARARILSGNTSVLTAHAPKRVHGGDATAAFKEFLERYLPAHRDLGSRGFFMVDTLAPGETVVVYGVVQPERKLETAYRERALPIEVAAKGDKGGEILVRVGSAKQLIGTAKRALTVGLWIFVIGVLLVASGIASTFVG